LVVIEANGLVMAPFLSGPFFYMAHPPGSKVSAILPPEYFSFFFFCLFLFLYLSEALPGCTLLGSPFRRPRLTLQALREGTFSLGGPFPPRPSGFPPFLGVLGGSSHAVPAGRTEALRAGALPLLGCWISRRPFVGRSLPLFLPGLASIVADLSLHPPVTRFSLKWDGPSPPRRPFLRHQVSLLVPFPPIQRLQIAFPLNFPN